jgi:LmbE family N-acetylglucosaminyl deacetylase
MRPPCVPSGILLTLAILAGCAAQRPPLPDPAPAPQPAAAPADDGKLWIIAFGAHPDDCEIKAGGTAARWASLGHHVMFVSMTNGDIGHWEMAGGPLARRRAEEAARADGLLGATTHIMDNHDGELEPTLENRKKVVRLIREWKADIVLAPGLNDYHPDHRYSGILVQACGLHGDRPVLRAGGPYLQKNPHLSTSTPSGRNPRGRTWR